MKQPTEQEIKEFWEGLGIFEIKSSFKGDPLGISTITVPKSLPPIDLNSLFKYAVPKLQDKGHWVNLIALEHKGFRVGITNVIVNNLPLVIENDDPALALFWAIKQGMEKK